MRMCVCAYVLVFVRACVQVLCVRPGVASLPALRSLRSLHGQDPAGAGR